jgi:hypothetical protein
MSYYGRKRNKMKAKQNHTVGTAPKYNRKTKNTTLSEQFQNLTEKQKIPHYQNNSKI